jgi:CDP-glucose 4,6-dehydratase
MKINKAFWKNKRVLVTGHTGFKGSWLVAMLNHLGCQTHGIALLPDPDRPSLYSLGIKPNASDEMLDIRDRESLNVLIAKIQPQFVFHLAAQALVLPSYEDPITTFETNIIGTANVAVASLKSNVSCFINITSDKAYENREWPWAYRETDAMGGHDPYSASKGAAELVATSLRRSFFQPKNIPLASMRAGNVIGGGDWARHRIVPDLMQSFALSETATLRNPGAIRPWQHVLEPLRAYILVAEKSVAHPELVSQGWNIGPDEEAARDVGTLADFAAKFWGPEAKFRIDEPKERKHEATLLKLDSSLIKKEIGWRPLFKFEEALKFTVEWYREYYHGRHAVDLCENQIGRFLKLEEMAGV